MVIGLYLINRKGASKILSAIVIAGLIISVLTIGLLYYPKVFQNKTTISDDFDNKETPSAPETNGEVSSESYQGNLRKVIEVLSTNITGWQHYPSKYTYYQIQSRIKNIGKEDLEIKYIVVDTYVATEKSTDEIKQLINSKTISENYLTEIQNKIITFGGETSFIIYTENLQNDTEYTIRLHFANDEDFMFNVIPNINSSNIIEYPKYAKVSIISTVCTRHPTGDNWTITLKLKNSGTGTAKLDALYINQCSNERHNMSGGTLPSGATITVKIYIDDTSRQRCKTGIVVSIDIYWTVVGGYHGEHHKLVKLT